RRWTTCGHRIVQVWFLTLVNHGCVHYSMRILSSLTRISFSRIGWDLAVSHSCHLFFFRLDCFLPCAYAIQMVEINHFS
ncbi:hypothetical protein Mapa_014032, partial [Marchantia paleacea]